MQSGNLCAHAAAPCLAAQPPPASSRQVIEDFEQQMKDAVNEDTSGKRRNETTWKVNPHSHQPAAVCSCARSGCQIGRLAAQCSCTRPCAMQVTRIHWEKNRFIYDLMYNRKVCGGKGADLLPW